MLIIWDWDNTLMNTKPAVEAGLRDVIALYGQAPLTPEEVVNVMTEHRGAFWQKRFKDHVPEAIEHYVRFYLQHLDLPQVFEKTVAVLEAVKAHHIPQVVLSNKNHDALIEEVEKQGLSAYFDAICGTVGPLGKPDLLFVEPLLKRFNPQKVILIGDGLSDCLMAQNMGATFILVHRADSDMPCDYACPTLNDVLPLLEKIAF